MLIGDSPEQDLQIARLEIEKRRWLLKKERRARVPDIPKIRFLEASVKVAKVIDGEDTAQPLT